MYYSNFGFCCVMLLKKIAYCKVASSNTSCLMAHAGFFRLLIKGIFYPYLLWPFEKIVMCIRTCDYKVSGICVSGREKFSSGKSFGPPFNAGLEIVNLLSSWPWLGNLAEQYSTWPGQVTYCTMSTSSWEIKCQRWPFLRLLQAVVN